MNYTVTSYILDGKQNRLWMKNYFVQRCGQGFVPTLSNGLPSHLGKCDRGELLVSNFGLCERRASPGLT